RRMFDERILHFKGPDRISRTDDDIVRTTFKPKIAIFIPTGPVTGQVPFSSKGTLCSFLISIVSFKEGGGIPMNGDISHFSIRDRLTLFIDQRHPVASGRLAHRSRL